jgi:hypothetical protein
MVRRKRILRKYRSMLLHFALPVLALSCNAFCQSQDSAQWHKTIAVSIAQPLTLNVHLIDGDLQIAYAHEGEVSIMAQVQPSAADNMPPNDLSDLIFTRVDGNNIVIQQRPFQPGGRLKASYRIGVPYRTELHSSVSSGGQMITGLMGPINAHSDQGNIHISYIAKGVYAETKTGDVFLEMVGERATVAARVGSIVCARINQGVNAETGNGDIALLVVGPSAAKVIQGTGRIEARGLRGTLIATTDIGDLQVKAVPHDDWELNSRSGAIRLELPRAAKFDLHAVTEDGDLVIGRDDLSKPSAGTRELKERVNGGGKRIEAHSKSGRITVS